MSKFGAVHGERNSLRSRDDTPPLLHRSLFSGYSLRHSALTLRIVALSLRIGEECCTFWVHACHALPCWGTLVKQYFVLLTVCCILVDGKTFTSMILNLIALAVFHFGQKAVVGLRRVKAERVGFEVFLTKIALFDLVKKKKSILSAIIWHQFCLLLPARVLGVYIDELYLISFTHALFLCLCQHTASKHLLCISCWCLCRLHLLFV